MRARLTKPEIEEMVSVAESIAAGKTPPPRFFELWPDIAPSEDKDVTELWFSASYYENDSEAGAESAEYFREAMIKYASSIRERFQLERRVKWTPKVGQRETVHINPRGTVQHVQETTPA